MYPTSATLYTSGCRILNLPTIQPAQVVITPKATRQMIPGTIPSTWRTEGTERTPRPIWVLNSRTAVAVQHHQSAHHTTTQERDGTHTSTQPPCSSAHPPSTLQTPHRHPPQPPTDQPLQHRASSRPPTLPHRLRTRGRCLSWDHPWSGRPTSSWVSST